MTLVEWNRITHEELDVTDTKVGPEDTAPVAVVVTCGVLRIARKGDIRF